MRLYELREKFIESLGKGTHPLKAAQVVTDVLTPSQSKELFTEIYGKEELVDEFLEHDPRRQAISGHLSSEYSDYARVSRAPRKLERGVFSAIGKRKYPGFTPLNLQDKDLKFPVPKNELNRVRGNVFRGLIRSR